jgi:hypothetical protein
MSKQDKKRDNYLRVAYIILKIAPYAIEKYVDKHYSGGFIGALRDKAHISLLMFHPFLVDRSCNLESSKGLTRVGTSCQRAISKSAACFQD